MKRNNREDFTVVERFKTLNGEGVTVPAPVPRRVRIEYYVKSRFRSVVCERNGDEFKGCRLTENGFGLECAIPLFVKGGLESGTLKHRVTVIHDNDIFPVSEQYVPIPEEIELEGGGHIVLTEEAGDPEDNTVPAAARPFFLIQGPPGPQGGVIWPEIYVDEDLYLTIVEPEHALADRISFDQDTGYVTII